MNCFTEGWHEQSYELYTYKNMCINVSRNCVLIPAISEPTFRLLQTWTSAPTARWTTATPIMPRASTSAEAITADATRDSRATERLVFVSKLFIHTVDYLSGEVITLYLAMYVIFIYTFICFFALFCIIQSCLFCPKGDLSAETIKSTVSYLILSIGHVFYKRVIPSYLYVNTDIIQPISEYAAYKHA